MAIRKLEWDSKHFGFNIAHLDIGKDVKDLSFVDEFTSVNNIDFIQSCCNIDDLNSINLLENHGFRFADLRTNFILNIPKVGFEKNEVLIANKNDIPAIRKIAKSIFTTTRYCNKNFDKNKVSDLYEIWVEKSIKGEFDDLCLKELEGDKLTGFVAVKILNSKEAKMGIMGIDKKYQNMGVGSRLLGSLCNFLNGKNICTVSAATQGKNIRTQNFLIKNGFRVESVKSWYYKFVDEK